MEMLPMIRSVAPDAALDAEATGALARLASDVQAVEQAIGNRFSAAAVVANFNLALGAASTGSSRAWPDFYFALARFLNVASMIVSAPPSPDTLAAFGRLQKILGDDLAETLFPAPERRRLMRRLRRLVKLAAPHLS
jgi:hypothetical protein